MSNPLIQTHLHQEDIQTLAGFLSGIANDLPDNVKMSAKRFITKEKIRQACKEFDGIAASPRAITFCNAYEQGRNFRLLNKSTILEITNHQN